MAMSALRDLTPSQSQNLDSAECDEQMAHAVASGVSLLEQQTPRSVREVNAMPAPRKDVWWAGMDKEMDACIKKKVWTCMRRAECPEAR